MQFQYDPKTELAFIYQEGETELFQSVLLIAKYALRHMHIPSLFAEDSDFVTLPYLIANSAITSD